MYISSNYVESWVKSELTDIIFPDYSVMLKCSVQVGMLGCWKAWSKYLNEGILWDVRKFQHLTKWKEHKEKWHVCLFGSAIVNRNFHIGARVLPNHHHPPTLAQITTPPPNWSPCLLQSCLLQIHVVSRKIFYSVNLNTVLFTKQLVLQSCLLLPQGHSAGCSLFECSSKLPPHTWLTCPPMSA